MRVGSEGRSEQTISTDQDNALIRPEGSDAALYLAFARDVNDALDACGCGGELIAATGLLLLLLMVTCLLVSLFLCAAQTRVTYDLSVRDPVRVCDVVLLSLSLSLSLPRVA